MTDVYGTTHFETLMIRPGFAGSARIQVIDVLAEFRPGRYRLMVCRMERPRKRCDDVANNGYGGVDVSISKGADHGNV
jgi:hypothetical protein